MMKRFFVALVLVFSVSFSFSEELENCSIKNCYQVNGSGCYSSAYEACKSNGFSSSGGYGGEIPKHWRFIDGGGNVNTYCWKSCDNGDSSCHELHKIVSFEREVLFCPDNPDDPCGNGKDPATCDMDDPPPDNPDDPCGNGKDPATCDMDDPPPDNPDDPCGNGKDPATCDMDDDPPQPDPPKYDDDYKPDEPPCQIMVNGKCVNPDNGKQPKICQNGFCKCFSKRENGTLKEVPCSPTGFYDESCSDPYDAETCSSKWWEDMFPEIDFNDPDDPVLPDYNPNAPYDDFDYNFGDLDTSHNLPNPKQVDNSNNDKNKVDLSDFGVTNHFNASGQCPAPVTVSLGFLNSTMEVSFEYFCSIARILRAVVIAFAWLSALLIIARINRG